MSKLKGFERPGAVPILDSEFVDLLNLVGEGSFTVAETFKTNR
jgi:hypothetical protein